MQLNQSLCETCRFFREVVSGKGSRFLMCLMSQTDARFRKYPPQPIRQCSGYERREPDNDADHSAI
jgi:hypothetical protein